MRKEVCVILLGLLLLPSVIGAVSQPVENEIRTELLLFEDAVQTADTEMLDRVISNVDSGLYANITSNVDTQLQYEITSMSFEEEDNTIQVDVTYNVERPGWYVQGFPGYFEFQNVNGEWKLTDTSFPSDVSSEDMWKIIGGAAFFILVVGILVTAIAGAFWLWMLIDCVKREFNDKLVWIILLTFTSFIGAMLYFILVKHEDDTSQED